MKTFSVAVVGATGLVGRKMIQVLEERHFPVSELHALASQNSLGKSIQFNGRDVPVQELTKESFQGVDIAIFSAGAAISKEFAMYSIKAGTVMIDNSSAFRMTDGVPLVVPEVNPEEIMKHKGVIANPNCSTIQMVVALKPLHDKWVIKRIVVSTYQSVTGAGKKAVDQLLGEISQNLEVSKKFPHPIAYNALPQIDIFFEDGYSREEHKMGDETRKIFGDQTIKVNATCVRIPSIGGHSESVNVEFFKPFTIDQIRDTLTTAKGVCVQDDISRSIYPMPIWAEEKDDVFVGRIRRDDTVENGLNLWIVSDNLRKGAATNAVQIAEEWIKHIS
ncbi:MAG: aspartate-semialdehyde dehydrogenase [Bacteroidota bacterium]